MQAIVAAQHGHSNTGCSNSAERSDLNSVERGTTENSLVTNTAARGGETSTSTQGGTRHMKVINKKLITMSTQKVHGRNHNTNGTDNSTANNSAQKSDTTKQNKVYRVSVDKVSTSNRPSHLNLNFNIASHQSSTGVPQTATNQNHHSSALSRFNTG